MKKNVLKKITVIALIIFISMIGFFGIYVAYQNRMENVVKDYTYAMDINGARTVRLEASIQNKEIIKDADGKIVDDTSSLTEEERAEKGYTTEEVPYNDESALTTQNYQKSKEIIETRLKKLGLDNYIIKLDEEAGDIFFEIDENSKTDEVISQIATVAKFSIIDSETQEELMNNNDIKLVNVLYGSNSNTGVASGTQVYLNIEFNKEGTEKLKQISSKYVASAETSSTENSEESTESKENKISMKIDDETIMETAFDQTIETGKMQLSIGTASTDNSKIQEYAKQASEMAVLLDCGNLPVKYDVSQNQYVLSDITKDNLQIVELAIAIVILIALIVLVIKYKIGGLLTAVSYVGLVAIFLLTLRYANVVLALEGIFAVGVIFVINYIFASKLLSENKKFNEGKSKYKTIQKVNNNVYKNFIFKIIPICIMSIVFCFMSWVTISSFGMVMFWGILLTLLYNYLVTCNILKLDLNRKVESKQEIETKKDDKKEDKEKIDKKDNKTSKLKKDNNK